MWKQLSRMSVSIFLILAVLVIGGNCSVYSSQDLQKLKQTVLNMVNDDIWFFGKDLSSFRWFEMQSYNMEVYVNNTNVWAVFHNKNKGAIDAKAYYLVKFSSDNRGLLNEYDSCVSYTDLAKLSEKIKSAGYLLDQKTEIQFPKAVQPVYPPVTKGKEAILGKAKVALLSTIKQGQLGSGNYKIYVANFRDNGSVIRAAVESSKGGKWLMTFTLLDSGEVEFDQSFHVNNDNLKKWEENCKNIAVLKEQVKI